MIVLAGIYTLVQHTAKIGFLSPLYRKVGEGGDELFLYSHHHEGRMWLIGRSYDRWNIRLDLVEIIDRQKPAQRYTGQNSLQSAEPCMYSVQSSPILPIRGFCPNENPSGYYWEYLSAKVGDEEVWTKDESMRVVCADPE